MNIEIVKDSNGKEYKKLEQTCFHIETPDNLCRILNELQNTRQRARFYYGNPETGKLWFEEHDIFGYVGRSTGSYKIPLLVNNSRSFGGGALMDNRILRITTSDGKRLLYQNDLMIIPSYTIEPSKEFGYAESLIIDGELHANCKKAGEAEKLAAKLGLHLISVVNGIHRKGAVLTATEAN